MKYLLSFFLVCIFYIVGFSQYFPTGNPFSLKDFELNGSIQYVEEFCFSKSYLPREESEDPNKKFKKEYQLQKKFDENGFLNESIFQDYNHKNKFAGYNFKKDKPMKPPKYFGGKKILKQVFHQAEDTVIITVYESKFIGLEKINYKKIILQKGKTILFEVYDLENNLVIQNEVSYNELGLIVQINEMAFEEKSNFIYEYDEQNNLISETEINKSQNDSTITKYLYNENNLLTQKTIYSSYDQTYYVYKYFYNENNLLIKLNFVMEGEYDIDYFYSYNEKKDIIEEKTVFSLPEIEGFSKTHEYKYDKFDNLTEYKIYHNGVLYQYYQWKYKYF